eukprot:CAMPEP_0183319164 /NCGR_PEP_ID=MMETSP0160_2-20130417/62752_1 /TAXON_ID=2839 ORGANISM="Odontella Sinensis, Strain Grunow 1884" /NCGR_SAMPLE_ID=MMETSP0160_2 /ASSEMBLY_ACC=CAM_ASM_000250 /LENGTH=41 /DNA_ID= /DNA_START= /DNA_END= /DNA_ORIENTATION=
MIPLAKNRTTVSNLSSEPSISLQNSSLTSSVLLGPSAPSFP